MEMATCYILFCNPGISRRERQVSIISEVSISKVS